MNDNAYSDASDGNSDDNKQPISNGHDCDSPLLNTTLRPPSASARLSIS